jgi:hypothetical protein
MALHCKAGNNGLRFWFSKKAIKICCEQAPTELHFSPVSLISIILRS